MSRVGREVLAGQTKHAGVSGRWAACADTAGIYQSLLSHLHARVSVV